MPSFAEMLQAMLAQDRTNQAPQGSPPPPLAPFMVPPQMMAMPDQGDYLRSAGQIIPMLQQFAPHGIPWQQFRRSENVEDRRGETFEDFWRRRLAGAGLR